MAYTRQQHEARMANLDALRDAVDGPDGWYTKEKERLEKEVQFLRAVKEGRGASSVEALNLGPLENLTVTEIQSFLGELPPEPSSS
jgi:hypothetical protein